MPGTTLPPDQGASLDRIVQRLERMERRVATVDSGLQPKTTGAGSLARIHVVSSGTASTFAGGPTSHACTGFSSTSWSSGADLLLNGDVVAINQAGIYAISTVFSITSNNAADAYNVAAGLLIFSAPVGSTLASADMPDLFVAPALNTANKHTAEFALSWTGYLDEAGASVYVKAMLQNTASSGYGTWDYDYADIYVQQLAVQ